MRNGDICRAAGRNSKALRNSKHSMSKDFVLLEIKGLGHVPSKKNSKMLTRGRLITKPEYQKWIERCIRLFESELRCMFRTRGEGMQTGRSPQFLIAWSKQFDDSVKWIRKEEIEVTDVPAGDEGAIVILEEI